MNLSITKWIKKSRSLDVRQTWDLFFWWLVFSLGAIIAYLFFTYTILVFPIFILFFFVLRLLIINNSIAIKEIKKKR